MAKIKPNHTFKRYISLSYKDRLNDASSEIKFSVVRKPYREHIREKVVENGRVCHKMILKTIDNLAQLRKFKVTDFALENLIEIESPILKNTVSMSRDTLSSVTSLENSLSNIKSE